MNNNKNQNGGANAQNLQNQNNNNEANKEEVHKVDLKEDHSLEQVLMEDLNQELQVMMKRIDLQELEKDNKFKN